MKGFMLILSAPSGTGKTTIANEIAKMPEFVKSISATTRAPRPGEVEGVDYFYVSAEKFEEMKNNGELFESACFNGNWYGTIKKQMEDAINAGKIMLFTIENDGMKSFKEQLPNDSVTVFILPPSLEELEKRITLRGDEEESIKKRMDIAKKEISYYSQYDYTVINDDLSACIKQVEAIITAEKLKSSRAASI